MGMFDYIKCDYPLPGVLPVFGDDGEFTFQTKDLECGMREYLIDKDGNLRAENVINYTGTVCFYTSNIRASGPGIYTSNGEDAVEVEYYAKFLDGKLLSIEQTGFKISPALPSSVLHESREFDFEEEYPEMPLDLKRCYVFYGGQEKGYYGTVMAMSNNQICIKIEDNVGFHKIGDLEIIDKRQWGSTLFLNQEDGFADKKNRSDNWNKKVKTYEEYAATWVAGSKKNA